jgi:hypothetical protein
MMIIPTMVVAHHTNDLFFFLVGKWYLLQVKEAFIHSWHSIMVGGDVVVLSSVISALDIDILKTGVGPTWKYGTRA